MADLHPFVEKIEEVPEAFREFYTERSGKFYLNVAGRDGWALEDVRGLRNAHAQVTSERNTLRDTAKRFRERIGGERTPDEIADALNRFDELVKIDPEKQADELATKRLEAHEARIRAKFDATIKKDWEPLKAELEDERSFTRGLLIDTEARTALLAAGADPDHVDLLVERLAKSCRVKVGDDKKRVVEVLDEFGNPRLGEGPMKQAAGDFRAKYPALFKGSDASGSGARGGQGGGGGAGRKYSDAEVNAMSQQEYEKARTEGRI